MKTMIVATDFSEDSGAGLREATKIAKQIRARILLVLVQNTTDIRYALKQEIPLIFENSAQLKKELANHVAKKFDSFIRKYGEGYPRLKTLVLHGIPWQEITRLAREKKATLIVVGARGLSPFKAFLVGSTTQNLIRISQCPVVVIHKTKKNLRKKEVA